MHEVGIGNFALRLRQPAAAHRLLQAVRLERAIGVIYRPETERASHYFHAQLPAQFDAILHYDVTRAVEPLERAAQWDVVSGRDELDETFPSAL